MAGARGPHGVSGQGTVLVREQLRGRGPRGPRQGPELLSSVGQRAPPETTVLGRDPWRQAAHHRPPRSQAEREPGGFRAVRGLLHMQWPGAGAVPSSSQLCLGTVASRNQQLRFWLSVSGGVPCRTVHPCPLTGARC